MTLSEERATNPSISAQSKRQQYLRECQRTGKEVIDDFYTPKWVVQKLFEHLRENDFPLPEDLFVWEGFCGSGNLVKGMQEMGIKVVGTDKFTTPDHTDFFKVVNPADVAKGINFLVTNPVYGPSGVKEEVLEKCYAWGLGFCLLLPFAVTVQVKT